MFKRLTFLVMIILFLSCSEQQKHQYEVNLKPVTGINDAAKKENQYIYRWIASFAVDHEESIYIVDNMSNDNRLIKIDKSGRFQWKIDSKGQGPGEFLRITDVCCYKNQVFVCDQNRRKILIFSNEGKFVDEFKVDHGNPVDIEISYDNVIYISSLNPVNDVLLHKYKDGKYLDSIINKRYHKKNALIDSSLNSFSFCIDQNNDIILAFKYFYFIYKYDSNGKLLKKWSRELPYKPQKIKLIKPAPNQIEIKGDPVIQDISADSSDRIYVLWGCKSNDMGMQVDLFSSVGILLSEFRTGIKPYYDLQLISIGYQNNFYVANRLEEPGVYKFLISIRE